MFNSYYVAAGPRHARPERGLITRPNSADVAAYRAHVDRAVGAIDRDRRCEAASREIFTILEIGLHHEQQHQELLLTDILHAFAQNPTHPAYDPSWDSASWHTMTTAMSISRQAFIRSVMMATAFISITSARSIAR